MEAGDQLFWGTPPQQIDERPGSRRRLGAARSHPLSALRVAQHRLKEPEDGWLSRSASIEKGSHAGPVNRSGRSTGHMTGRTGAG